MTTIVYKDGVLAADTLITEGNRKLPGAAIKAVRLPDGHLFAYCGSVADGETCLHALLQDEDLPPMKHTTAILIDHKAKRPYTYEGRGGWLKQSVKWGAWGSGSDYAYGALEMGATAVQAVKVAIKYDAGSRGPIRTLKLG
jgi:ATP-dependent protease HslVU (ClpYQ) peptidase subunit